MKIRDVSPFIRFAANVQYKSADNPVYAPDCRIIRVLSGNGNVFIENQLYEICAGSSLYLSAGTEYNITSDDGMMLFCINFDLSGSFSDIRSAKCPEKEKDGDAKHVIDRREISDSRLLSTFGVFSKDEIDVSLLDDISDEINSGNDYSEERAEALLKLFLIELHRIKNGKTGANANAVRFVCEYINKNFRNSISNKSLAKATGYHEYYLNRVFEKQTGKTIHRYILDRRMNEAKKLLLCTNLPIDDISAQIGFCSNTHFSSFFKKEFGLSPHEFRRKHRSFL